MRLLTSLLTLSWPLLVLGGCVSLAELAGAKDAALPTATPLPSPVPLMNDSIASCPVSLPNGKWPPNDPTFNLGNEAGTLFTIPWAGGKVIFTPGGPGFINPDGSLAMKWPWYRTIPGDVIITGQRLDAPAPPMPTITLRGVHDGYNETGFHPSGLLFPSAGCWEVKAKVGEASLIFVTLVVKIPFDPVRPAWMPESLLIKDWDVVLPQSIREIFGSPIWADPLWRKGLIGWAEGEVIVETTQGLPEQRDPYPEAAQQQVTVSEQPGVCVQGAWDKQHHWQDEADAGALEWGADGFSYRISHNGLGLHCKELLRIVGSTP